MKLETSGKHRVITPHVFVESRLEPDPEAGWLHPQWAMWFRCERYGTERRYGVVDATGITEELQRSEDGLVLS